MGHGIRRTHSRSALRAFAVLTSVTLGSYLVAVMPADAGPVPAAFTSKGPAPITGGQVENLGNGPVTGAVQALAPNPANADELWVGSVNGGIWRTENATAASPSWTPLTDDQPDISIGALTLDPTIPTNGVLVAGLANFSSDGRVGSALTGLLRTTNGGNSWTRLGTVNLAGQNINGVVAQGSTIVTSSANNGVWRSTNTGTSFTKISGAGGSGLPGANATWSVVADPGNLSRLYVATSSGVYRSDDTGATWTPTAAIAALGGTTGNAKVVVHRQGGTSVVYVGFINGGQLAGLFASTNGGTAWTALDLPQTNEGTNGTQGLNPSEEDEEDEPGGQGGVHFSMAADPGNANVVYLGGDRQPLGTGNSWPNSVGANDYVGRLFRCDRSLASGSQCAPITNNGTAGDTAPHADSRNMAWDANGDLLEVDDGGVYRQTDPATGSGDWESVIGSLQVAEHHSCDYDNVANVVICGDQDTGVPEQSSSGSSVWRSVHTADGGKVTVDDTGGSSIRYSSTQQLGNFTRRSCTNTNVCGGPVTPSLLVGAQTLYQVEGVTATTNPLPFYNPIAANEVAGNRLVIGTGTRVYESTDNGDNLTVLSTTTGGVNALVYGGRANGVDVPGLLFVAAGNGLYLRPAQAGTLTRLTTYTGGTPVGVAVRPDDWRRVFVVSNSAVYASGDGGATFTDISGNLAAAGAGTLYSVGVVPVGNDTAVIVGGSRGTYITQSQNFGAWARFAPSIPNTLVYATVYDAGDNALLVGTHGRGSFLLSNASGAIPSADLGVTKTDSPDPVIAGEELFYTVTVSNSGPDTAYTPTVVDQLPPQVDYLSDNGTCTLGVGNRLTCTLADLPSGASKSITIKTRVKSGTVADEPDGTLRIQNTATVGSVSLDPDLSNNTAVEQTFVQEKSDLQVTKVCVPNTSIQAGQTANCTVYVDNVGPSSARNLTLTDTNNSTGTFTLGPVTASAGSCSVIGTTVTCTLAKLAAASSTTPGRWSVTIPVTADEAMDIDDTARVVSDTPDPDLTNNERTDTISVSAVSDLALTKSGPASAVAGTQVTYNLSVTNNGPSTATGVVIRDVLPLGVTIDSVAGSGGATCNAGIPGNAAVPTTCSYGTLAKTASRTMTVVVTVDPDFTGSLTDNARADSDVFDSNAANDLGTVTTNVVGNADLGVSIAATPNPVIAGDVLSYRLTVRNNGPSVARNVTATVPLPASLTFTSSSVSLVGACGLETNTNKVQCDLGDLAKNGQAFITIYTTVSPSLNPGSVIGTTATVASDTTDPGPTANSASVSTNVITSADLDVRLTSNALVYKPSTIIHYFIKVTNSGLSDARDVVISQVLPAPKVAIYNSNDGGCPAPSGGTFSCSLGTIKVGESKTVQLNLLIRGNKRTITQTARVTSSTTDPDLVDNASTLTVTVK